MTIGHQGHGPSFLHFSPIYVASTNLSGPLIRVSVRGDLRKVQRPGSATSHSGLLRRGRPIYLCGGAIAVNIVFAERGKGWKQRRADLLATNRKQTDPMRVRVIRNVRLHPRLIAKARQYRDAVTVTTGCIGILPCLQQGRAFLQFVVF